MSTFTVCVNSSPATAITSSEATEIVMSIAAISTFPPFWKVVVVVVLLAPVPSLVHVSGSLFVPELTDSLSPPAAEEDELPFTVIVTAALADP